MSSTSPIVVQNNVQSEAISTNGGRVEELDAAMEGAAAYGALIAGSGKGDSTSDIRMKDGAAEPDQEFLSNFISQNSVFRALGDISKVDIYHCTPWGSRANWAASRKDWVQLRDTLGPGMPSPRRWHELLLATLFNQTLEFESKLTADLKNENISGLAKAAFCEKFGSIPNIHELAFMDAAFRVLLLDRSMYMRSVEDGMSQPDEPHVVEEPEVKLVIENIQEYLDVCTDWMGPLNKFCSAWATWPGASAVGPDDVLQNAEPSTRLSGRLSEHQAVLSLLRGYNKAMGQTYIARVQENFAMAALALRAMFLVCAVEALTFKRI